jgi:outer membrane protein OmpA-like peptidoglycan-associated protein
MSASQRPMVGFSGVWLLIAVLLPAWEFARAAEVPSQTPAPALVSPVVNLEVTPPMELQFQSKDLQFQPMDLQFQSTDLQFQSTDLQFQSTDLRFQSLWLWFQPSDLQFHIEDVKGAVQALVLTRTPTEVKVELSNDVLFDLGNAEIRPEAEPALHRVADLIRQYRRPRVAIDGYTDANGEDAYNLQLSMRRAAAVKSWLVEKGGMNDKRIETKGWGKANPVAPNTHPDGSDNPEGRRQNRRVVITVKE